ncbi:MAG: efflux RND transporter periplasmic adaptor subunit [Burkholderiales bacterium]|jgi:HlyD family secretion protein|nr:efflux RND transporter periplasmic adaptor subunit [Burkholderiales bacterium]
MTFATLARPRWIVAFLLLAALAAATVSWFTRADGNAPTYRFAKIERGAITATVSATGTLNPVSSVQVGSQVSGQIKELFVDFNSPVKNGQLIARIDPETFTYRVRQAEADTEAARSAASRAQVALINAQRELNRTKELVARNFVSSAELDSKQATYDLAAADVRNAQAVVKQREASLASAKVDLGRTEIRAPVDGTVIKRSVDVGQTVAASLQAPELFIIARDLRDMQVETSIDEADVGRIRVGQKATFTVDSFPGRTFNGTVKQVRQSAQNVQNVVTYTVLVTADNDAGLLLPGMTANVRIVLETRDGVLKVSNAALRFRPPGESAPAVAKGAEAAKGDAGGAAGGQGAQFRERLTKELKLDDEQQKKLDPIFAQLREKFAAARDLPEEARGKAQGAARAELRAKIEEILKPEQEARFTEIVAEFGRGGGRSTAGRLWVLADGKPKAIDVRVGLTDGAMSEVSGEGVVEGLEVIVGQQGGASPAAPSKSGPPRMMF